MIRSQRGLRTNVVAVIAIALALSACSPATTSPSPNGTGASGSASPAGSQTFVYAVPSVPTTLDYATYEGDANYVTPSPMVAVDAHTVELHVNTATSLDVADLSVNWFIIYDSQEAKQHATAADPWAKAWLAKNSDTFGPWHVSAFDPGNQITYVQNQYYWGPRGNISTFILKAVPDAGVRGQLLQSGAVDWAARLTFAQYGNLQGTSGVTVKQCVSPNRDDLVLQQKGTKFADLRVRQAISLAIDRAALVKGAYQGYYKPAVTGLTQFYQFSPPYATYEYNVATAKQLLAEAGYPNGFDMTLTYNDSRPGPWADQSSALIKSMLAQVGINVTLKLVGSYTDFNTQFVSGAFEAVLYQEPPLIADPYFSAAIYNVSTSFQNHFGFKDPAYDELVYQIAHSPAGTDRDALVSKLADLGVTDYPVIYLTDDVYLNAYRSNISGIQWDPSGDLMPSEYTKQ